MKCPFCAEEIQDDAVLCRFCGAVSTEQGWMPPERVPIRKRGEAVKGRWTLRLAGVLFLASAAFESLSLTSDVVVAGAVRTGAMAVVYHLVFVALYAAMGVGLSSLKHWGYAATMIGVAVYSVDRLWFLLDDATVKAWVGLQLAGLQGLEASDMGELFSPDDMAGIARLMIAAILAGWWGFAAYVYSRRVLFAPKTGQPVPGDVQAR